MSVMENAKDLADLKKKINDSENQINNLDLNKDDEIDIVKVVELDEKKKPLTQLRIKGLKVVPPRIELGTHGFSVHCSTN